MLNHKVLAEVVPVAEVVVAPVAEAALTTICGALEKPHKPQRLMKQKLAKL